MSAHKIEKIRSGVIKRIGEETERTLRFTFSDETPDRDNDILSYQGWNFTNYEKNPVFLICHDYYHLPIGKAVNWGTDGATKSAFIDVKFPTVEEYSSNPLFPSEQALLADTVYNAYVNGYMRAVSAGFIGTRSEERADPEAMTMESWRRGRKFTEMELLEVSAVGVPANPNALIQARDQKRLNEEQLVVLGKMFKDAETKGVIPYKKFPLADEGAEWDAGEVEKNATVEDLKKICTWVADKADEDLTKGDFKLPHHDNEFKTVWRGVAASMAVILGARGGVDIPEADREGCYNHLVEHYKEFDKEPPEFKTYTEAELKQLFAEEEEMNAEDIEKLIEKKLAEREVKAGAKYSADTLARMKEICDHIEKGLGLLKQMHDSGTMATDPDREDGVEEPEPNDEGKEIDPSKIDWKNFGL